MHAYRGLSQRDPVEIDLAAGLAGIWPQSLGGEHSRNGQRIHEARQSLEVQQRGRMLHRNGVHRHRMDVVVVLTRDGAAPAGQGPGQRR